jgi:quinolinate synthase
MARHCAKSESKEFIIGTEEGLVHRLKKENPKKIFYSIPDAICPNMKKISLEDVLNALITLKPKMHLSDDVIRKARAPLDRMVAIGRQD